MASNALSYMRRKTWRYVRNVGRSVGYVATEEIKPHSSAITQLYRDSKELSNNLKNSVDAKRLQRLKEKTKTTTLSASANNQKKKGSTFSKNLLSDLRSGKWYNKERMDISSQDKFDMGADADNYTGVSFNFDDDDFGDSLFNDGQGGTGSGSTVSRAFNQVGMAATSVAAEANIRSAEFIANSNNTAVRAIHDSMNYNFGQVMTGLSALNTNIQLVQATVGDTLNTHALNSAKFYIDSNKYQQESLELLKKISSAVEAININTSPAPPGGTMRGSKEYTIGGLLGGGRGGLLDFKALAAGAKKGFKEEFLPDLLLMLGLGGDIGGSGGGLSSNPIGLITTNLMRLMGIDPLRRLKSGIGNVNNTINNFFGKALVKARGLDFRKILKQTKINDKGEEEATILSYLSPLLNDLKDALLPKSNYTKINTGNYNKRKVDWDGIARKSLVEVIPTQLGKILSALTGENEMRYDFEHGKWVDTHKHLENFNANKEKDKAMMGGDFMAYASALLSASQGSGNISKKEADRMNAILKDFNNQVYKTANGFSSEMEYLLLIDPNHKIDENLKRIAKSYGINNEKEIESLRDLAAAMRKTPIGRNALNSYGQNMSIARDIQGQNYRYKESLNDSMINMLVDGSYTFGNAAVARTKASSIGSRANWNNNKQGGLQSLMYVTDKYNHDMFYYLQGIFLYTKHVSDNLPLIIGGVGKGKKGKIKGAKIIVAKDVEPIMDEVIDEGAVESSLEDLTNALTGKLKISDDNIASSNAQFDEHLTPNLKEHARARQYTMQRKIEGIDESLHNLKIDPDSPYYDAAYAKDEEDFLRYVNRTDTSGSKIRGHIEKLPGGIGKKITGGYDKFIKILEAVGGSKADFEKAIGWTLPGNKQLRELRKKIAESKAAQDILSADTLDYINPPSAKGRKVTKTGVVAVSEGELIIPSELNPFYHGVTNKSKQIKDERKAVQQYFGNYALGGTIFSGSGSNYNGKNRKGKKLTIVQQAKKAAAATMRARFAEANNTDDTLPELNLENVVNYLKTKYPKLPDNEIIKRAKNLIQSVNDMRHGESNEGEGDTEPTNIDTISSKIKNKVHSAINTVNDGLVNIFGSRDEETAEEEKKKLGGLIDGIMKDAGMAKSSIITGAVLGGGVSLLTGAVIGPVAGAAIGAATGLIIRSDKVQKALFGEDVVDEDTGEKSHKDGLLPKKLSDFMQQQLPSVAKGTAGGVLAGSAFFGSPIIGGIVGASLGYIKSSEKAKDFLFGGLDKETGERKDNGLISKNIQNMVKKAVPNIAAGAALGLLAGPFSIPANIIMGSALGFASSTNKFQEWLYGKPDANGKREGGFADEIKTHLFDPIGNAFKNLTSIASQQVTNLGKSLAKTTRTFMFKFLLPALIKVPFIDKIVNAGKKLLRGAIGIATLPGKGLDRYLRRKALKKGYTIEGLTSAERLQMRLDGTVGNAYDMRENSEGYAMDTLLSSLNGNEERDSLLASITNMENAGRNSEDAILAERRRVRRNIRQIYKDAGLKAEDAHALNVISAEISRGKLNPNDPADMEKIKKAIREATKNRLSSYDNSNETYKSLMESLSTISSDETIRENEVREAKQSIEEIINKNTKLSDKQKELLKKKLISGKTRDIEYVKNQLGIDKKAAENQETRVKMSNEVEEAIKNKIPNKIELFANNVGHLLSKIWNKMSGEDVGESDSKLGVISKESAGYIVDKKNKESYYADLATQSLSDPDAREELLEALQNDEIPGMARGGIARKGLAAVSKGELILPRNVWGRFAGSGSYKEDVNNSTVDTTGEDNNVIGQHGNVEENLGSKKVQEEHKRKNSFFSAIQSIPVGFAAMNSTLTSIKDALTSGYKEGSEKKKGLLDILKDSFFGGATGVIGKFKSIIVSGVSTAISTVAPVLAGLIGAKIALAISKGKLDKLGEKLGWGEASHKGDTFIDADGDQVTQDPETGMYVKEDGTSANGKIKAVNSTTNDSMSDKFNYNFARGIITGKGTAAFGLVKGFVGMTKTGSRALNAAKEAMKHVNVASAIKALENGLTKFVGLFKKIPFIKNCKFVQSLDDLIFGENGLLKYITTKLSGSGAKNVLAKFKSVIGVVNKIFIVTDALTGWQDAEKILGIKKATTGQRFLCSLGRALLRQIPVIGTFLPEKPLIQLLAKGIEHFFPGEKGLTKQQDELQEEVDQYNEDNGTNLSVDEYQTQILGESNIIDKAGNAIKSGFANIKQSFAKNVNSGLTTAKETITETSAGGSYMGSYAEGGVVGTGATSLISGAVDTFRSATDLNKLPTLVEKIKDDVDKGDVKSIIKDVSKIGLGVAAGSMFPALIGPALVNTMINKITGTTNVNKSGSSSKFISLFSNLEKIFTLVKDGDTTGIDALQPTTDSGMFKGIFNVIKGIAKIAAVVTNPIQWLGQKLTAALGLGGSGSDTSAGGSGFVSQFDPRYKNMRLGGKSIADNGCGPATAVMAINQMNAMSGRGTSMNAAINHASRYQTMGGTDAAYFADEFARNGYKAQYSTNRGSMLQNIAAGRPTILMGRAGGGSKDFTPFGPNNHYVVANGIDSRGNIIISDPEQGGARSYSPSILNQVRLGVSGGSSGAFDQLEKEILAGNAQKDEEDQKKADAAAQKAAERAKQDEEYNRLYESSLQAYSNASDAMIARNNAYIQEQEEAEAKKREEKKAAKEAKRQTALNWINEGSEINQGYQEYLWERDDTEQIRKQEEAKKKDEEYNRLYESSLQAYSNASDAMIARNNAYIQEQEEAEAKKREEKKAAKEAARIKNECLNQVDWIMRQRLITIDRTGKYTNPYAINGAKMFSEDDIYNFIENHPNEAGEAGQYLIDLRNKEIEEAEQKKLKNKAMQVDKAKKSGKAKQDTIFEKELHQIESENAAKYKAIKEKNEKLTRAQKAAKQDIIFEKELHQIESENYINEQAAKNKAQKAANAKKAGKAKQENLLERELYQIESENASKNKNQKLTKAQKAGRAKQERLGINTIQDESSNVNTSNITTGSNLVSNAGTAATAISSAYSNSNLGSSANTSYISESSTSTDTSGSEEKTNKYSGMSLLSAIGSIFGDAFSNIFSLGKSKSSSSSNKGNTTSSSISGEVTYGSSTPLLSSTVIHNMSEANSLLSKLGLDSRKTAFYSKILEGALQGKKDYGIPPSITLAQAAIESRWGESGLTQKSNNLFGIKAGKGWTGGTITMPTREVDSNGNSYMTNAAFRAYNNWNQSVNDHSRLLGTNTKRYGGILNTDYLTAATALGKSGYATDPSYGPTIKNQIEHDKLYEFDGFAASGSGLMNSKLYNTMGNYIANRGVKTTPSSQEVHYVGSGSQPIIHKTPSHNYMVSGKPVSTTGFAAGASVPMSVTDSGSNKMIDIVDTLCDIVQVLTDHVPNVTKIYEILEEEKESMGSSTKGTSSKKPKLKDSSLPPRIKTNEQIAASLSELKAQVRQIVI